ncbi:MAG: hypothetical protein JXA74_09115, partial [Anaerolineae bacterium]|nr:hypothetical protein [Anaerolineae bacterium]
MSKKTLGLLIGGGCLMSILSIVLAGVLFFFVMPNLFATPGLPMATPQVGRVPTWTPPVGLQATQEAIPAFTPPPPASQEPQ